MGTSNCERSPPTKRKLEKVAAVSAVAAGHSSERRIGNTRSLPLTSPRLPPALTCDPRPFGAPLTQLARAQTQSMFPVKVKVEKSGEDPEVGGLREYRCIRVWESG